MKKLVILNHQVDIPPFMVSAIQSGSTFFDKVFYINTRDVVNRGSVNRISNVSIHYPSKIERMVGIAKVPIDLFRKSVLEDLRTAKKIGILDFRYFIAVCKGLAINNCLCSIAENVIDGSEKENVVVLSTWFAFCAYSAANLKRKYPKISSFSMAHSYEILVSRNPRMPFLFKDYKFRFLDGTFFIAHEMRKLFFEGVGINDPQIMAKTHVCYLGSYKIKDVLNKCGKGNMMNICTCSRMIPLKRLNVLAEALRNWNACDMCWTHLGGGETEMEIRNLAEEIMKVNSKVKICITGKLNNHQIHNYYVNNEVDLFLNLSSIEGLPISIMEAISYGIPVLATDVGGTKELVNPSVGNLLPREINPILVKDAILDFYNKTQEEKDRMRVNAFELWNGKFNAEKNYNLFFQQMLSYNNHN